MAVYHAFKSRVIAILDLTHDTFVLASIRLTNKEKNKSRFTQLENKGYKIGYF